ncbi:unnamed protein product, partial [Lampetra fluviatilis]
LQGRGEHPPWTWATVRETLLAGNFSSPAEFARDVRLVLQNALRYTPCPTSRGQTTKGPEPNIQDAHSTSG